jgi:hypothetical protein
MMQTPGQRLAIRKTIEEAAKLITELSKPLVLPEGTHNEYSDLIAALLYLFETGAVKPDSDRILRKLDLYRHWNYNLGSE